MQKTVKSKTLREIHPNTSYAGCCFDLKRLKELCIKENQITDIPKELEQLNIDI
ncbi:hypothetical protein [Candidatus Uabimicrobium sp. HlEnr_7]|uniref:hypothetical protein n=1 Tax=Candidatus Uabimicrobium helgolandensis TaxID=3095367 RepID=UPI003557ED7E